MKRVRNWFRRLPIRRKLTVTTMVISTAALLVSALMILTYERFVFRQTLLNNLLSAAEIIGRNSASALSFNVPADAGQTLNALAANRHIEGAAIYGKDGKVFVVYQRPEASPSFRPPPQPIRGHRFTDGHLELSCPIILAEERLGTVHLVSDLLEMRARFWRYALIVLIVTTASSLLALGMSRRLQGGISEPILHLATVAREVAENKDYAKRAVKRADDEMGRLIDRFNEMLNQIQSRDRALEEARATLEQRVAERTGQLQEEIRERGRIEEGLERERNLLQTLIDHIPDGIYIKDTAANYVLNNPAHLRHLGAQSQAQTVGRNVCDFLPSDLARRLHAVDLQVLQSGEAIPEQEEHGRDISGGEYWRSGTKIPLRDAAGRVTGLLGISRDITERKRAGQALAYERDLFNTLLETVPDHVYFKDREARFVKVSRSFLADLGLRDPAQLLGKTDFDFFTEPNARAFYEDDLRIMESGQPMIGVIEQECHQNGRTTWAMTTKMPWRDTDGRTIGTFGISRDITALKRAEEQLAATHQQLLEASHLAGRAEVATGVLHNVGNVLNSVNVSAALIADTVRRSKSAGLEKLAVLFQQHREALPVFLTETSQGRQIPGYLDQLALHVAAERNFMIQELTGLQKNIDHIKDIVAMQQNYARLSGVRETVEVPNLVEDAIRLNAAALARHGVQVVCRYDEAVPKISVERHKVLQILVNLVRNAKYACDESGLPGKQLAVQVVRENGSVKIRVRDNGVGIAPENLTRIFGHGFTTRKDGHGFGLHSSALAAQELGGMLSVHSDGPGTGATFTLEIPVDPPPQRL